MQGRLAMQLYEANVGVGFGSLCQGVAVYHGLRRWAGPRSVLVRPVVFLLIQLAEAGVHAWCVGENT
eukprot:3956479-Lingulodinium_polyedra.AAC.1